MDPQRTRRPEAPSSGEKLGMSAQQRPENGSSLMLLSSVSILPSLTQGLKRRPRGRERAEPSRQSTGLKFPPCLSVATSRATSLRELMDFTKQITNMTLGGTWLREGVNSPPRRCRSREADSLRSVPT